MRRLLPIALVVAVLAPGPRVAAVAADHLRAIVNLSTAPEYRRAGTAGMLAVADYIASRLDETGYEVVRQNFGFRRYAVDYSPGHEPLLDRDDGQRFKTESAFNLGATTPPDGISCTVRAVADVTPGDCGLVGFEQASPEWKNEPFANVSGAVSSIVSRGGIGAVIQGDVRRDLVFAISVRSSIPAVVAVANASEIVGRQVRMRAMGGFVDNAPGRNVIGIRRPPSGASGYAMLLAHSDGWFQAAADNAGGVAGILRAAALVPADLQAGVIVAAMDAEEVGLNGSKAFEQALSTTGLDPGDGGPPIRLDDVKAIVNLDASSARASEVQDAVHGITRTDAPLFSWRAMVFSEEKLLGSAFLARFTSHGVLGLPMNARTWRPFASGSLDGSYRSDVHWFANKGIPFAWPVGGYPEYHTDGDTVAHINAEDLDAVSRAAAELVGDIAVLPLERVPQ